MVGVLCWMDYGWPLVASRQGVEKWEIDLKAMGTSLGVSRQGCAYSWHRILRFLSSCTQKLKIQALAII